MQTLRLQAIIRETHIIMLPVRRGNRNPTIQQADFSERNFSDKSMRRLKRIGANWSLIVRYALYKKRVKLEKAPHFTFFTFTLASEQIHTDNEIKRTIFQPLFTEIQKANKCTVNYIWRAEAQFNGNIHFHVLFDKYLDIKWLRSIWNRLQDRLGYIERSKATNPSGVDVEDVKSGTEKHLVTYISKYMSKAQSESKVNKFSDNERVANQKSTHRIQKINHIQTNNNIQIWNKNHPEQKPRKNVLRLVPFDTQRGIAGKMWGCSRELKDLDCRLSLNLEWNEAGALISDCEKEGAELKQINNFVNVIIFKSKPLELFIGATLFSQFWDIVAVEYLKLAPIFEAYRYVNYNIA